MLRLGIIGCGEHAEGGHAVPLARYRAEHPGEIELAAACDLQLARAQKFCKDYGFLKAFDNIEQMLSQERLDGCVAVMPVEKIAQVGIMLLQRGIPCVVEKPLGASIDEIRSLVDVARASATPNMVSVNRRFMPFLNRAIDWSKQEGPLRYVRCAMTRHARTEPDFLWSTGIHAVDTMRYIAGSIAVANIRTIEFPGQVRWYAVDIEFESGAVGRIDILPTAGMAEEVYELSGDGFYTSATGPFGARRGWRHFRNGQFVGEELTPETMPEDVINGCYQETSAFIRSLTEGLALYPSITDVVPSVEICLMLAGKIAF